MAHGPSPFGIPQREQEPDDTDADLDRTDRIDRARGTAPAMRLSPEQMSPTRRSAEEEMEDHLERIHASRPLRRAAQRAHRRTRWWLIALAVVSGVAVVAACGAGAFIVLREGETAPAAQPQTTPGDHRQEQSDEDAASDAPDVVDPIERRGTDAAPISVGELFGSAAFTPAGAAGQYEVLETEELADCADAGLDELAELLADADCAQTVRATLVNPDGEYAATAGVLNLADAAESEDLRKAIEDGLEGGFSALRTDGAGAELGRAATMVGYNTYGHFLMYVVIGRTDGEPLEDADEAVISVVNDIVDVWLVDQLKPRRDSELDERPRSGMSGVRPFCEEHVSMSLTLRGTPCGSPSSYVLIDKSRWVLSAQTRVLPTGPPDQPSQEHKTCIP
ncbi:hypothetical protein L0U85_19770 [Glycomyces sp. L485]|uniref:hypothetical protein n=1 Tax=Glycomyces sp. L485 TaxID=2909235 RepID=UPI001F4AF6DF|nr:hypothetical protein [Glycomyces sp. L485]MCH7233075.1 hypothetical protein [Glycomyces sp. L485]